MFLRDMDPKHWTWMTVVPLKIETLQGRDMGWDINPRLGMWIIIVQLRNTTEPR